MTRPTSLLRSCNYTKRQTYGILVGQFESGLPYCETLTANGELVSINTLRSPSHFVLSGGVGHHFHHGLEMAFNVSNLLDKEYIIASDNVFRRSIYGERRAYGLKATWNF